MINFLRSPTKNYALVQDQLFGLVQKHLPAETYRESVGEYIDGCLNFTLFIDQRAEVLMSHGAADKTYHWKSDAETGKRYNQTRGRRHLLVPGNFLLRRIVKSRWLDFGESQVHSVGWPRLDLLYELQDAQPPRPASARKRVLWAPTHDFSKRGEVNASLSSYPAFQPYFDQLSERYDTAVSLHPRNRFDKKPTERQLIDCDVVITDHGTMVYEAWALGKQVIFPYWLIGERMTRHVRRSAESKIFQHRIGLHADTFEQMVEMIEAAAPMDATTREFLDNYLDPRYARCSGRRTAEVLLELDRAG